MRRTLPTIVLFVFAMSITCLPAGRLHAQGFFDAFDAIERQVSGGSDLQSLVQQLDTAKAPAFTDVKDGDWFAVFVRTLAKMGIIGGYKDAAGKLTGKFGPGDNITVIQAIKISLEAAQVDEGVCTGTPAHAVPAWANAYMVCAEKLGLRVLADSGDFNRPVKRGEFLGVVHDAFAAVVPAVPSPFADAKGHAYEQDIAYAAALDVVSGQGDTGKFDPNGTLTRAAASKILYKELALASAANSEELPDDSPAAKKKKK